MSFLHYIAFFKFTEYSSDFVIAGDNDEGHGFSFTFDLKFVLGTHAGPLDLHKESGLSSEFLHEQLLDNLISFFWSVDSEANLRDTGGTALAWAHT